MKTNVQLGIPKKLKSDPLKINKHDERLGSERKARE